MTGADRRVACVIPAFDAEATLGTVVAGLRRSLPGATIVVVDDGSRDATGRIARSCADLTVRFPRNRGKGAALRAGLDAALGLGCQAIVTVDADGQHDARWAPALVDALARADMAVGARSREGGAMPLQRRITNRLSATAVSRCIGRPVPDAQSGFRAFRASLLREVAPRGDRYEYETQLLVMAARRGYRVTFLPVPTRYPGMVPSRFRPVRDSARIVAALLRLRVGGES